MLSPKGKFQPLFCKQPGALIPFYKKSPHINGAIACRCRLKHLLSK